MHALSPVEMLSEGLDSCQFVSRQLFFGRDLIVVGQPPLRCATCLTLAASDALGAVVKHRIYHGSNLLSGLGSNFDTIVLQLSTGQEEG
jgi:hypothetical protein